MKSKGRQTFLFYRDWYDTICKLDDSTALEVCKAIMSVAFGEEPRELSSIAEAMLLLIRPQIERDIEKWSEVRAKRQEVGRLGGLAKATNCYQLLPNATKCYQKQANVAVNVNDNVNIDNNNVVLDKEDKKEKEDTIVSKKKKPKNEWRKDKGVYLQLVQEAENELIADEDEKKYFLKMFPSGDFERTVLKTCQFWRTDKGYEYKLKSKSTSINMTATIKKNLDKSVVYANQPDFLDVLDKKDEDIVINGQIYR